MNVVDVARSTLDSFKAVHTERLAAGGENRIDIAVYMTLITGDVYMGHTEILRRPFPHRLFVQAVTTLVRDLRVAAVAPWATITMCLDTYSAPMEFSDAGAMARDLAENPASTVRRSIAVFAIDSEGMSFLTVAPYRVGDDGLPLWEQAREVHEPGGLPADVLRQAVMMDVAS